MFSVNVQKYLHVHFIVVYFLRLFLNSQKRLKNESFQKKSSDREKIEYKKVQVTRYKLQGTQIFARQPAENCEVFVTCTQIITLSKDSYCNTPKNHKHKNKKRVQVLNEQNILKVVSKKSDRKQVFGGLGQMSLVLETNSSY